MDCEKEEVKDIDKERQHIEHQDSLIESQGNIIAIALEKLHLMTRSYDKCRDCLDEERAAHAKTKKKLLSYKKGRWWTILMGMPRMLADGIDGEDEV